LLFVSLVLLRKRDNECITIVQSRWNFMIGQSSVSCVCVCIEKGDLIERESDVEKFCENKNDAEYSNYSETECRM
jgi:hypothetical protein